LPLKPYLRERLMKDYLSKSSRPNFATRMSNLNVLDLKL